MEREEDREEEGFSSGEGYESSREDWVPEKGEGEESSTDGEGDETKRKVVAMEGVKRKLQFMDEGRGRRGRRGNISKSRRIYSLGRGRGGNGEEEGGEIDEDLEEGGFDEGDPQEGEGEMADSSADSSPGGSRICLPP